MGFVIVWRRKIMNDEQTMERNSKGQFIGVGKVDWICDECGKKWKDYIPTTGYRKYCSQKCWFKFYKVKRITKKCLHCKKNFRPSVQIINKTGGKYCSRECRYADMKNRPLTKKHGKSKTKKYRAFYEKRRMARKKGAVGNHTLKEWEDLKGYFQYMCVCCKRQEPEIVLTEDHIIPLSNGGSDNIENIQPLCRNCNSRKATKTISYISSFYLN